MARLLSRMHGLVEARAKAIRKPEVHNRGGEH